MFMRRATLVLAFIGLAARAARCEDGSFRGLRLGADLQAQIPECRKDGTIYATMQGQLCWQPAHISKQTQDELPDGDILLLVVFVDNGALPRAMIAHNFGKKLLALTATFDPQQFPTVEEAFRIKYGPPMVARDSPWQSVMGVRTVAHHREWRQGSLYLSLDSPADSIDHAFMRAATQTYLNAAKHRATDAARKAAKNL